MTIRKGDTVKYIGRDCAWLNNGWNCVVVKASSSHVKVERNGQPLGGWYQIENFELVRSVYSEYEMTGIVCSLNGGPIQFHTLILGPGEAYRDQEHARQVYTNAGYVVHAIKKIKLPYLTAGEV